MKVFDIILEPQDIFCVYLRDEHIITKVNDKDYPYPCTKRTWDKVTNTFSTSSYPYNPDKLVFPTFAIKKEDFNDFLRIHIPEVLKREFDLGNAATRNIIIIRKEWGEVFEVGLSGHRGNYPVINEFAQKIVDQYLRLKVFW